MTTVRELRARHEAEAKANLLSALERAGWSLTGAARELGVVVSTVQRMIKHHGLEAVYAASDHPRAGNPHREKRR
jgi:transcriptional regulator of acetoin/glycerol metabolism